MIRRAAEHRPHLLAETAPPPPRSPLRGKIKGIFLPLGNQIKASHLPRAAFARRPGARGGGTTGTFNTPADEPRIAGSSAGRGWAPGSSVSLAQPQQGCPLSPSYSLQTIPLD